MANASRFTMEVIESASLQLPVVRCIAWLDADVAIIRVARVGCHFG